MIHQPTVAVEKHSSSSAVSSRVRSWEVSACITNCCSREGRNQHNVWKSAQRWKQQNLIFSFSFRLQSCQMSRYIEGWMSHPCDGLSDSYLIYQLLVDARACKCVFVCVCLRFPAGRQTISGSVPHPLQCLIGQTDQSERGFVVSTKRPCVPWAWAWGGQCETTTRCYTSSAKTFQLISDTKLLNLIFQANHYCWAVFALKLNKNPHTLYLHIPL